MNGSDEDVSLVEEVARGSQEALARLYDRHGRLLLGLLTRILGRRDEAEDVLQEVLLQVWRQAPRYDRALATPAGWMVMLARSRALDRLRSASARHRREQAVGQEEPTVAAPPDVDHLDADVRRGRLLAALESLPPEQRRCLELAFFEGLSHSMIAERIGAPLGTVKSRILMGMGKLRLAASEELAT